MDKKKLKEIEALSADHEQWDNHVGTVEHTQFVSDEEQKEIDEGIGLQMISLRLGKTLIEQFKELAKLEGIGYQPLMRQVLTAYAKQNEDDLITLLSAPDAAERADRLFVQAVKLRSEIPGLAPLSNERIFAESDFSKALSQAQKLFKHVLDNVKDPILKQHAKLRMKEISELCQAAAA